MSFPENLSLIYKSLCRLEGVCTSSSGGVKADIVVPSQGEDAVGFLARTKEGYAEAILKVVGMEEEERIKMERKKESNNIFR